MTAFIFPDPIIDFPPACVALLYSITPPQVASTPVFSAYLPVWLLV